MGNSSSSVHDPTTIPVKHRLTYNEKVTRIVTKYNFRKMESPYDSVCAFYFDDISKYMWLVQNIGRDCPLFTKPTKDIMLELSGYHMIMVNFEEQPYMFHP